MSEDSPLLTRRGFVILRRLVLAAILLTMVAAGVWMLNQVLDSVAILGRPYVDFLGYPVQVDVWTYHDAAYTLLWVSYVGLVLWEMTPWKPGHLRIGRVIIALLGFALLTAGLWISQDLMNAVLTLHRSTVDLPFFVVTLDWLQARDLVVLLTSLAYFVFYVLSRVAKPD